MNARLTVSLVATVVIVPVCCIIAPIAALVGIVTLCANTAPVADGSGLSTWDDEQLANAATIIAVGVDKNVPRRGWIIAVATAIQESRLRNLGDLGAGNDHDSLGLFQQRPSQGWGTPTQILDPRYATTKFYDKLLTVPDWQHLPLTRAAQAVQVSA